MFDIKLDFSNGSEIKIYNQEILFFDEISLIDFICTVLYENEINFIVSDDYCGDYGMNCKFDLPCLLEVYDDIISGLLNRKDFSIEFYEQGREYFISFVISDDDVKLHIRYGYDNAWDREERLTYCYIKNLFIDFYGTLFEYIKKCFSDIEKNSIFNEWNMKLCELKLQ